MQDRQADHGRDLDIVSDPRSTPPRISIFDPDHPDRWIEADERSLVELALHC